jgi:hypothetical protein
LHQAQTGLVEEEPKTKSSKRDLRISDNTLAILQKHEEEAEKYVRKSRKKNFPSPRHTSFIALKKRVILATRLHFETGSTLDQLIILHTCLILLEPICRFELQTYSLRMSCSTN